MKQSPAKKILQNYASGICTDEEKALAEAWYEKWNEEHEQLLTEAELQAAYTRISSGLPLAKTKGSSVWLHLAIAAAVATVIFGAYLFKGYLKIRETPARVLSIAKDIDPGKYSATLTLANGRKIRLNDTKDSVLTEEAGMSITKTADGQLLYQIRDVKSGSPSSSTTNTLSTANGETYVVTLPDRTMIWLNAASSITYAPDFTTAAVREVQLSGEAYFEVAKNKTKPFVVKSAGQEVKVLGTHFNVKGYPGEQEVKTTLLEGSVRIAPLKGSPVTIVPGQQSVVSENGLEVRDAQPDMEIAWKHGDFVFVGQDIKDVMRTIARWYDVEVDYQVNVPQDMRLKGEVSRSRKLSTILKVLEGGSSLKFNLSGKKITITR